MRFRITQRFDAPLDAVEGALLDPAFLALVDECIDAGLSGRGFCVLPLLLQ